ncbi:MAG: GNAT family N-acetyltransferase [Actinomycetota bacterium]
MAFRVERRRGGVRVRWMDSWNDEVDAACRALPATSPYSLESYRLLCDAPVELERRLALVEDAEGPMAVIGMWRSETAAWTPVSTDFLPGDPFPCRAGCFARAVRALGVEFEASIWDGRLDPFSLGADLVERAPSHRARAGEIRAGWSKKHRRTIKQAQDRCGDFRLELNGPDAAEWVAGKIYERWEATTELLDIYVALCRHLHERDELQVVRLFDGDRPIGGQISVVLGGTLYMIEVFREPGYEWHGLGNRLIELTVDSGIARGDVEWMDLESQHGHYKRKWAPEGGHVDRVIFRPRHIRVLRRGIEAVSGARRRVVSMRSGGDDAGAGGDADD